MNKTLKRRVFRHTALYAAILMFSHTGGGGGGGGPTPPKAFFPVSFKTSPRPETERELSFPPFLVKKKKTPLLSLSSSFTSTPHPPAL
ncbi:hypothetical protein, partial [Neisseria meningitidis]|uniref:hypothetical protein n=1 Tax=Neisseria meningitidis TaxID=487 RepID=UPI0011CD6976